VHSLLARSDMPIAGVGWVIAAAFCYWLQKWSKG